MYSLRQLKKGIKNPELWLIELNRLYYRRLYSRDYHEDGVNILAQDWDTLVILDACRYDLFSRHATLPGRTDKRVSRGASTIEFLKSNFGGRQAFDTVYVTANPQLAQHRKQIETAFHAEKHVWKDGGWDEEYGTVLPSVMTNHAIDAANQFPRKRLIFHYLQPHQPFIGETAPFDAGRIAESADNPLEFWERVKEHTVDIPEDDLVRAYEENLREVLHSVRALLETIDGKTVVTADHGELIKDRIGPFPVTITGHPQGIYVPPLVDVPWHVYESGERRDVVSERPEDRLEREAPTQQQLEALGYVI